MPAEVACSNCGHVLRQWEKAPPNVFSHSNKRWYDRLFNKYQGKCPNCGHKLPDPKDYVENMNIIIMPSTVSRTKKVAQ